MNMCLTHDVQYACSRILHGVITSFTWLGSFVSGSVDKQTMHSICPLAGRVRGFRTGRGRGADAGSLSTCWIDIKLYAARLKARSLACSMSVEVMACVEIGAGALLRLCEVVRVMVEVVTVISS